MTRTKPTPATLKSSVRERNRKRFNPTVVALKEIRGYQKNPDLQIRKCHFQAVVKSIMMLPVYREAGIRIDSHALAALHEAGEKYVTDLFEEASEILVEEKRGTLYMSHINLVRWRRGGLC
jgi:histone H3/H4